jgi:hypothetical protein
MQYNEENLKKVSEIIKRNLTPDLLPKKWVERNASNPTFGHCHNSAGCLQKVFGSKNIKMYRALDNEGIYHWWAVDITGKLIDLTAEQYTSTGRQPPYATSVGEKSSILGFEYRKRVQRLYEIVLAELEKETTEQ